MAKIDDFRYSIYIDVKKILSFIAFQQIKTCHLSRCLKTEVTKYPSETEDFLFFIITLKIKVDNSDLYDYLINLIIPSYKNRKD